MHIFSPSWSEQCGVKKVRSVGSPNDKDILCLIQTVQLCKKLRDNTVHHTTRVTAATSVRGYRVQFIKEDNTWGSTPCPREHCKEPKILPSFQKFYAISNSPSLIFSSLCPTYLLISSGPFTLHVGGEKRHHHSNIFLYNHLTTMTCRAIACYMYKICLCFLIPAFSYSF